jgi:ABC-type bacteriocin/lantibiotic exporter with double-glycine peptidase domain
MEGDQIVIDARVSLFMMGHTYVATTRVRSLKNIAILHNVDQIVYDALTILCMFVCVCVCIWLCLIILILCAVSNVVAGLLLRPPIRNEKNETTVFWERRNTL